MNFNFVQAPIRRIPAGVFLITSLASLYLGILAPSGLLPVNDKILHLISFFMMGLSLYWVLDISKRKATQMTAIVLAFFCVSSEVTQSYLTVRPFDSVDIVANMLGSAMSLGLNIYYHGRLLKRRRDQKYAAIGMTDLEEQILDIPLDIEDEDSSTDTAALERPSTAT